MSVYVKNPQKPAQACIIWLHGLGADASDMQGVVQQFLADLLPIKHVFLDAPLRPVTINNGMTMRAWYDITGFTEHAREDLAGIQASENIIRAVMHQQIEEGFTWQQIFLAGFSQGGAMALFTGLHTAEKLGGILTLSGYLPASDHCSTKLDKTTPFFIAGGTLDQVVLPAWTTFSKDWLQYAGYTHIEFKQYPMEHNICSQEIQDISLWLGTQIQGDK